MKARIVKSKLLRNFMAEILRIMNTKLTLNVDHEVIRKAKQFAKSKGRSLSDLVESYLKMISENQPAGTNELSPRVKALCGAFSLPADFDYKKELGDAITRKHLSHDQSIH
jgi:uncharacterized protein (DUF3820 family)